MVEGLTTYQLWYGRDEPPPASRELRAGPVGVRLVGRDLRNLRYGGRELAQRIYVAIRDRNWDTLPGEVSNVTVDDQGDRFAVAFDVRHRQHDIDFAWRGEISGDANGVVSFAMDAVAGADLTYKLIGFNVHHAMAEYAGRPYEGETPEGPISGDFPSQVEPQYVVDATEVPIFPAVSQVAVELADGVGVRFDFEGDTFEFEDQRNWTDASFKSQSLPPRRGGFYQSRRGEHVRQKVTVTPSGPPPPAAATADRVAVTLGAPTGRTLPPIGFGLASHGGPLSARETELLRRLRPAHLRVDLRLTDPAAANELARGIASARALDAALELALIASDDAERELAALAAVLERERPAIARVLVFHEGEQATSGRWLALARGWLRAAAPDALFAGGTNANFCELNRHRPGGAADEGIVYSINPQIHAFDELSLVENLAGQAETVATARAFGGGRPIVVSPVTFKQRFNAVATGEIAVVPGELPAQVDPRQLSLFGAGWTVGSVKYLAESGAASVTYYETTGWRGVIERDGGSPLPERFPSRPGMVFPMYHVFADLAEWAGGEVIAARSSDPLAVEALAVRHDGATHLLVANLTAAEQAVAVAVGAWERADVRRLNAETAEAALFAPERFRAGGEALAVDGGAVRLALAPYEVVRVDVAGRSSPPSPLSRPR